MAQRLNALTGKSVNAEGERGKQMGRMGMFEGIQMGSAPTMKDCCIPDNYRRNGYDKFGRQRVRCKICGLKMVLPKSDHQPGDIETEIYVNGSLIATLPGKLSSYHIIHIVEEYSQGFIMSYGTRTEGHTLIYEFDVKSKDEDTIDEDQFKQLLKTQSFRGDPIMAIKILKMIRDLTDIVTNEDVGTSAVISLVTNFLSQTDGKIFNSGFPIDSIKTTKNIWNELILCRQDYFEDDEFIH